MYVPNTETNGRIAPIIEILNRFLCSMNIDPVNASADVMSLRIPKIKNPRNSEAVDPGYIERFETTVMYWSTPRYPMLAVNAAAIIVNMAATSTNSGCFCCTSMDSCCISSSGASDFAHLGQKVASSETISLSQYGQFNKHSTFSSSFIFAEL